MTPCPSGDELQRLLNEQMNAIEESALEAHVAACRACLARLDQLTSGRFDAPTYLGGDSPGSRSPAPPGLVIERLAGLLPSQVQHLQQEYAHQRGNGVGHP